MRPRLVADAVEHRLQRMDVIGAHRDVGALVAAEAREDARIVVAEAARMNLHHQPVVEAHLRHLGQHLGRGTSRPLRRRSFPRARGRAAAAHCAGSSVARPRGRMAVIGRRRAHRPEERAARAMRGEIAAPGRCVLAGELAELRDVAGEAVELRIDDRIGAVGGDDAPAPAAGAYRLVMQRAGRAAIRSSRAPRC